MTKRLLIVEDDRWLGESYGRMLEQAGYKVTVTPSAREAIDLIDDAKPDAILLDMLLVETTGMALLHELQSHHDLAAIPVIIISSTAADMDGQQLRAYGVHDVLDKASTTPREILASLKRAGV